MTRDWTPSDQADAADWEADRNWWRRNPYADPDYRATPSPLSCDWCDGEADETDFIEALGETVCPACLEHVAEGAITQ